MGVILDYASERVKEMMGELNEFLKGPLKYVQENQRLRKAALLVYLDMVRPKIEVDWERRIAEYKGKVLFERPKL